MDEKTFRPSCTEGTKLRLAVYRLGGTWDDAINHAIELAERLDIIDTWLRATNHPDANKIMAIANGERNEL